MIDMTLFIMIATFLLTLIALFIFMKYAKAFGFIDLPNHRSMHTKTIPRGAGIAFVLSSLLVLLLLTLFDYGESQSFSLIYLSIAIIFIGGILDDYKGISPKLKFLFILFATFLLTVDGIFIHSLGVYLGYEITLPTLLAIPFTFFAIAGFTNALNLLDGLDGLAGTVSVIMMGAFIWIGYTHHDTLMVTLSAIFMASLVAFLLFNWYPAKFFMGDSGSLTLGFVIAILAIRAMDHIAPTAVLFILAIPVLDTFVVITRRVQRGRSPLMADKNHMHHILFNRYEDMKYTVIVLIGIQIAFTMIGLQLQHADNFLSLILFGLLFFLLMALLDQRRRHRNNR
ncbi:MAG: undecaprenyl/decaprenyl-phosphate alpha-N-acetylglucosaminyl 1-phosphate transferase [Hydrogenimonas sp.]|nr:MAG: undecaprenyl/decaprenyl-phosphate alpha-N-acetylglucosaminyl 1-phosphate transferase [Hydrogenimonas sp.]